MANDPNAPGLNLTGINLGGDSSTPGLFPGGVTQGNSKTDPFLLISAAVPFVAGPMTNATVAEHGGTPATRLRASELWASMWASESNRHSMALALMSGSNPFLIAPKNGLISESKLHTAFMDAVKTYVDGQTQPGNANQTFSAFLQERGGSSTNVQTLGVGGSAGAPTSQTISTIYQMSPDEAQFKLRSAMQQWLGRDPSQGEISDFVNAVNTKAASDPTTETIDTSGSTADKSKQKVVQKGFSATYGSDNMALAAAKASPDYASYQAATTYWNALQGALNASVQGVGVV